MTHTDFYIVSSRRFIPKGVGRGTADTGFLQSVLNNNSIIWHSIWGARNRMLDILFSFYYYLMKVEHLTFTGY